MLTGERERVARALIRFTHADLCLCCLYAAKSYFLTSLPMWVLWHEIERSTGIATTCNAIKCKPHISLLSYRLAKTCSDFIWDFGKLPFPTHLGKYIIKIGKIRAKIHEIGKIKAIFGLGMTPIYGLKNGQIKSLT